MIRFGVSNRCRNKWTVFCWIHINELYSFESGLDGFATSKVILQMKISRIRRIGRCVTFVGLHTCRGLKPVIAPEVNIV